MVTFQQALTENHFYHSTLKNADQTPLRVKRNGKTKVWKTRPNEFKVPVKYGLYEHGYITHENAHLWNVSSGSITVDAVTLAITKQ